MNTNQKNHTIDSLFTFLLLLVFCLFSLLLAGMGSAIYRNGTVHLNENYTSRTAVAYLSEKVRQHDRAGDIFFTEVEDLPAIGFRDTVDGKPYVTYVYFSDEALCELFVHADTAPLADMGTRMVELSSFTFERVPGSAGEDSPALLSVTAISQEGHALSALIHYNSKETSL